MQPGEFIDCSYSQLMSLFANARTTTRQTHISTCLQIHTGRTFIIAVLNRIDLAIYG